MRIVTFSRCLRYSAIAALLGLTWTAWAQEATGVAPQAALGLVDLLGALGIAPALAGPLSSLGLPGLLVYLAWRVGRAGGLVVQVRIPDDQLARLVAALRDDTDEGPKPRPAPEKP